MTIFIKSLSSPRKNFFFLFQKILLYSRKTTKVSAEPLHEFYRTYARLLIKFCPNYYIGNMLGGAHYPPSPRLIRPCFGDSVVCRWIRHCTRGHLHFLLSSTCTSEQWTTLIDTLWDPLLIITPMDTRSCYSSQLNCIYKISFVYIYIHTHM